MHQHAECDCVAYNIIADQAVLRIWVMHVYRKKWGQVVSIMSAASKQENNVSGLSQVY